MCCVWLTVNGHPVRLLTGARPPADWTVVSSASSSERIHFFLSLPQRNLNELERRFWAVSEPDSPEYGQFLSVDEIQSLVSPPLSERQTLIDWLVAEGVDSSNILDYGDSIEVDTTTRVAAVLFDADFFLFQHKDGRVVVRAMGDVSLPAEHEATVERVYGLTGFPVPHYSAHSRPITAFGQDIDESDAIIPQSLYAMYWLPRNTTVGTASALRRASSSGKVSRSAPSTCSRTPVTRRSTGSPSTLSHRSLATTPAVEPASPHWTST